MEKNENNEERVARIKDENKPDYINEDVRVVNPETLKKVLSDLHDKQEEDRRQMGRDINQALADGFRCGLPANYNHAQRAIRDESGKVIGFEPFNKPSRPVEEETQEELWMEIMKDTGASDDYLKRLQTKFHITRKK